MRRLRAARVPLRFVSNTTKEAPAALRARLAALGVAVPPAELFSSLSAARALVDARALRPMLLLEDAALPAFDGVPAAPPHSAVVLNEAFRVLRAGGELVAIHKGRYYARPADIALGPGAFVAALEFAAGVQATVVGKPAPAFFQLALDSLAAEVPGIAPSEVAVVGDDVRDDVAGAMALGMRGFLVRTGKFAPGDEAGAPGAGPPSAVFDTFAAAVDAVLAAAAESGAAP
ncbi:hypothetical protein HK105_202729 [Polyrhizophydium stewartii]|uniref:Haloacid dehalogenase-like hydrolase domain-containing protein 2 n=1 Tax=Polyrhizophydium stewartii TaxID=2732419 RepID=A0ABR4NEB1_9FUNG